MSLDHWRTVQRLAHAHEPAPQSLEAALTVLDRVIPVCTALAGYAFDDMTRDDAWRFLVMGRQLERMAFLSSAAMQCSGCRTKIATPCWARYWKSATSA